MPSSVVPFQQPSRTSRRGVCFAAGSEHDEGSHGTTPSGRDSPKHEELPFKVELWDEARCTVEQVLALTASGSIGYAAYFAATREYPDRYVTLRHKNSFVSQWNAPSQ
jgi:hypothetical protein